MEWWNNALQTCSPSGHCCAAAAPAAAKGKGGGRGGREEEEEELEVYCRRKPLEGEKDEGKGTTALPSEGGGKKSSKKRKRPKVVVERPPVLFRSSDRESNRWSHHVSTWIQRLKSTGPVSVQHDKGRPSALDAEFEIGAQVPRRYFVSSSDSSYIKNPVVKSDIFIFILFQRRTFLLPKFYPKSLHFFEEDSYIPPSSIRHRRYSEPNVFSLDSSYLVNNCDKKTIIEYENDSYPSQFASHTLLQSSKEPFILAKEGGTEESSVKNKIKEKLSWFFQKSKKRKLDETEVNESTFILPSKSRQTCPESAKFSTYSSTSSRPFLDPEILPSLPSHSLLLKPEAENEAHRSRSDSLPLKPTESLLLTKHYSSQVSLKCLPDDSRTPRKTESSSSPKVQELNVQTGSPFPQSNSEDFLLNDETKADSSENIDNQTSIGLKLKLMQDKIGKLADKLKSKYLTSKSLSSSVQTECSIFSDSANRVKEINVKDKEEIDLQNEEILSSHQIFNVDKEFSDESEPFVKPFFYSSLKFNSITRRLKEMSRRRSEETGNDTTEEPLPKHLRSMSLPEDSRNFHKDNYYPVRPQRKKYRLKAKLEPEPSDDETSVEGSPNIKYAREKVGSRKDLQYCRREFLSSMVSLSSTEEEDDETIRERIERRTGRLLHDDDEIKNENSVLGENSDVNSEKNLFPLYEILEDNCTSDNVSSDVNLNNIGENYVPDDSPNESYGLAQTELGNSLIHLETVQVEETLSEVTVKNVENIKHVEHSDKYCDNFPSVIEPFYKDVMCKNELYAITSTGDNRDTLVSAKVSDVSETLEVVNNNNDHETVSDKEESFLDNYAEEIVSETRKKENSEFKIQEQFDSGREDPLSYKSSSLPKDISDGKNDRESLSDHFTDEKANLSDGSVYEKAENKGMYKYNKSDVESSLPLSQEQNDQDQFAETFSDEDFSEKNKIKIDLELSISITNEENNQKENYINNVVEKLDIKCKETDKDDVKCQLNHRLMPKSESQPQIFVTPADVSEKSVERKEVMKNEKHFSFTETINHSSYRTEWSIPLGSGVIRGTASSVESQHGSSTIFSELESHSASQIENFSVSPNLSPRISSPVSGVSDIFPATPKSPITVQEWIDSLPTNVNEQRDDETYEDEWRDQTSTESGDPPPEFLFTTETHTKDPVTKEEGVFLGEEAFDNSSTSPLLENEKERTPSKPHQSKKRGPPPLTLKDIKRSISKDESEESPISHRLETTPCKRTLYAETRDKQTSFQSETSVLSGLSHQSVSSIESLLESRQLDPVDILLNLGFGSTEEEDGISRIPPRFLKPSKVPGNDINVFLRQEDNISDLVDSSDWAVPNIGSQGGWWASSPHLAGTLSPRGLTCPPRPHRFRRSSGSAVSVGSGGRFSPRSPTRSPPPPLWMYSPLIVQSLPTHERRRLSFSTQSLRTGSMCLSPDQIYQRRAQQHHRSQRRDHLQRPFQRYLTVSSAISPQSE